MSAGWPMGEVCAAPIKSGLKSRLTIDLIATDDHLPMPTFRLVVLLALTCFCATVFAVDQDAIRRAVQQGDMRPLTEILQRVQAIHPGRILDVDLEVDRTGRRVYEIELLRPDGVKAVVRVDAHSGDALARDEGLTEAPMIPLPELLRTALARYPGHVIDVELDREHYSVELALQDGSHVRISIDARDGDIIEHGRFSQALDDILPMDVVIERALGRIPGQVVEAELERGSNGLPFYELDILTPDADVIEVHVDATSGEILQIGEG